MDRPKEDGLASYEMVSVSNVKRSRGSEQNLENRTGNPPGWRIGGQRLEAGGAGAAILKSLRRKRSKLE